MINVIGGRTLEEFDAIAEPYGMRSLSTQKQKPLNLTGVGAGAAPCSKEAKIPIAVQFEERPASRETFQANVAEGCGEYLPAILGLTSMKQKDSVILFRD